MAADQYRFMGNFQKTIDAKGRSKIPPSFREAIMRDTGESRVILTRGLHGGIYLMIPETFFNQMDQLSGDRGLSILDSSSSEKARFLIGESFPTEFDSQGRIHIPGNLIESAHLVKGEPVVFVGVGPWVEIWNLQEYQRQLDESQERVKRQQQIDSDS